MHNIFVAYDVMEAKIKAWFADDPDTYEYGTNEWEAVGKLVMENTNTFKVVMTNRGTIGYPTTDSNK